MGRIDVQLLAQALNALGLGAAVQVDGKTIIGSRVSYANGQMTFYGRQSVTVDQVKQAYSAEVVKSTAKKYGWLLKETGPFQYVVNKRSF